MTGLLQCRLGNKDVKIRLDTAVTESLINEFHRHTHQVSLARRRTTSNYLTTSGIQKFAERSYCILSYGVHTKLFDRC
jgi:hypothetical protein